MYSNPEVMNCKVNYVGAKVPDIVSTNIPTANIIEYFTIIMLRSTSSKILSKKTFNINWTRAVSVFNWHTTVNANENEFFNYCEFSAMHFISRGKSCWFIFRGTKRKNCDWVCEINPTIFLIELSSTEKNLLQQM